MKLITDDINTIITKVFSQKSRLLGQLIVHWSKIVGYEYSRKSYPFKITTTNIQGYKSNILHITVDNSSIAMAMSYQQGVITERIAVYFGYKAIHKLRFITEG